MISILHSIDKRICYIFWSGSVAQYCIPYLDSIFFIVSCQSSFFELALSSDLHTKSFPCPVLILSQFLIDSRWASSVRGVRPNSSKTPWFVVFFCTPSICLQNCICRISTGLLLGSFRHPQKSLPYVSMGLTSVSNSCRVIQILRPPSTEKSGRLWMKTMTGHQNIANLKIICQIWRSQTLK